MIFQDAWIWDGCKKLRMHPSHNVTQLTPDPQGLPGKVHPGHKDLIKITYARLQIEYKVMRWLLDKGKNWKNWKKLMFIDLEKIANVEADIKPDDTNW